MSYSQSIEETKQQISELNTDIYEMTSTDIQTHVYWDTLQAVEELTSILERLEELQKKHDSISERYRRYQQQKDLNDAI